MKSKQFESQNLVFPPGNWIQKYATTPQIVKKVPFLLHGAVGTFRLPWRSAAEARGGAGGARRLHRGRAAAAPRPGGPGAAAGPRAPRDAHRGGQLGAHCGKAGKFSEAPLMCCAACSHRGGWMVLHFVLGKVGKNCRETTTTFSDHLRICHLCRSAIMHEHVNFTRIISNHFKSRHVWKCQYMDMSKFSKRCLQRTDAALQVSV